MRNHNSTSIRINRIDIDIFQHSTEDEQKIQSIIDFFSFPFNTQERVSHIVKRKFSGHYGNPVVHYSLVMKNKEAKSFYKFLSEHVTLTSSEFAERLDLKNNALHLRFSKTELISDSTFKLTDIGDIVKTRIKFQVFRKDFDLLDYVIRSFK